MAFVSRLLLGMTLVMGAACGDSEKAANQDLGGLVDQGSDQATPADLAPDAGPTPDVAPSPDTGPATCGAAPLPYSGALCGPAAKPCKVLLDERTLTSSGGGFSSLALDSKGVPHIAGSGGQGNYARRLGANSWKQESLGATTTYAHIAITKGDVPRV